MSVQNRWAHGSDSGEAADRRTEARALDLMPEPLFLLAEPLLQVPRRSQCRGRVLTPLLLLICSGCALLLSQRGGSGQHPVLQESALPVAHREHVQAGRAPQQYVVRAARAEHATAPPRPWAFVQAARRWLLRVQRPRGSGAAFSALRDVSIGDDTKSTWPDLGDPHDNIDLENADVQRIGIGLCSASAHREGDGWMVPLEATIFRPNEKRINITTKVAKKVIMQVVCGVTDFDDEALKYYEERARLIFRTWGFGGKWRRQRLEARISTPWASTAWRSLPEDTDKKGRIVTTFNFTDGDVGLSDRVADSVTLQVRLANEPMLPPSNATVYLVGQEGLSVISDIDDTVKITEVFKGKRNMIKTVFTQQFKAVESMADLYRSWVREYGANFQFVSKSPPELHEPLKDFFLREGFPNASLHLCPLFSDERANFKERRIEEILAEFPGRQFVFVGDSGETDPEVYARILRKHPFQVIKILVRQVDEQCPVDPDTFNGLDKTRWQVFQDPLEITLPLLPQYMRKRNPPL